MGGGKTEGEQPIPPEVWNELHRAYRQQRQEVVEFRENGMREGFLERLGIAGVELDEASRVAIGAVFQDYIDSSIHIIARAYGRL